jgi:hypothetical protein
LFEIILVVGLAGCVAAAALTFVLPLVHFITVWSRLTTIATTLGAYDSHRQAESASHPRTGIRPRPPERGHVRPALGGWANGLPRCWVIYGKTVPPEDKFDRFEREAQHYTDLAWTLTRRRRGRSLLLAQAPAQPEPSFLAPWVLPVGETATGPALWDVTAAYHCLVVARTGWGKSSFALWLGGYVRRLRHWQVEVIDPSIHDQLTIRRTLGRVEAAYDARDPLVEPTTRILLVIDETRSVLRIPAKTSPSYAPRRDAATLVEEKFLDQGGKRGIHVLALTVDARADAIGGHVRSCFDARLAGWLDAGEYALALDRPVPHARKGPRGRGWWRNPDGTLQEVQAHLTPYQRQANSHPPSGGAQTTTVTRIFGALGTRKW